MGLDGMILVFCMLSFKQAFSLNEEVIIQGCEYWEGTRVTAVAGVSGFLPACLSFFSIYFYWLEANYFTIL